MEPDFLCAVDAQISEHLLSSESKLNSWRGLACAGRDL